MEGGQSQGGKKEEDEARNRSQPASNCVEQATGEVNIIFKGSNGWVNDSAPMSAPHMLGIPGGTAVMITQQATKLPVGVNAPM